LVKDRVRELLIVRGVELPGFCSGLDIESFAPQGIDQPTIDVFITEQTCH